MTEMWRLLRESVLVQSTVTLILVCAVVFCVLSNRAVPDELWNLLLLIIGFWFGSKSQYQANQVATMLRSASNGSSKRKV